MVPSTAEREEEMAYIRTALLSFILFLGGFLLLSDPAQAASYKVNPNKTYTYSHMKSDLAKLKKAYPGLVQYKVIGKSEYGRNIYAVSLGKGESTVFINGSHHAREWMTTNVNMNMIDKYAYAYKKGTKIGGYNVKSLLNNTTIWFVPMVNPDGVTLQQSGLKNFPKSAHKSLLKMNNGSKDFKRWKANGKGIDLNRQYNAKWKEINSPSSPSYKNYKGKAPETAKEVKTMIAFEKTINPEMAVSYHSSGQIIYWDYQQSGARRTQEYNYAKKLRSITGYSLVYPKSYGGGGGFSDWFSRVKKKPAFTIEIAPYVYETNPPLSVFSKVWKENSTIGLYIAQEGFKLYDKRHKAASSTLTKKIDTYNKNTAQKLKKYYGDNVKTVKNLTVSSTFSSQYTKVKAEITKQEKAIAKLPAKYRNTPAASLKKTKLYRDRSLAFMNGVKAGDQTAVKMKKLEDRLNKGTLTANTVTAHQSLKSSMASAKKAIAKMEYKKVRTLAYQKYTDPAKDLYDNANKDLSRYKLLLDISEDIKSESFTKAKAKMDKLNKLNKEAADFKAKNPSRYKTYANTEAKLAKLQAAAEKQLKAAEAPAKDEEPKKEPEAPQEQPADQKTKSAPPASEKTEKKEPAPQEDQQQPAEEPSDSPDTDESEQTNPVPAETEQDQPSLDEDAA